jgi:hypothetical protein
MKENHQTKAGARLHKLIACRRGIRRIRSLGLRRDLLRMARIAENRLRKKDRKGARSTMLGLRRIVFVLNGTLTPKVATVVLKGLYADATTLGMRVDNRKKDKQCQRGWPNPATCQPSTNDECDENDDGCSVVHPGDGTWDFIFLA